MTMDRIGHRRLQVLGFAVMGGSFVLLGLVPSLTTVVGPFLVIYGVSYFFSEFGPNTTTSVMPAEIFPVSVRTTGHGLSAGIAKLGAFIGVYLFPIFKQDFGLRGSMLIASGASIAGMLLTFVLLTFVLPETAGARWRNCPGAARTPMQGRDSGAREPLPEAAAPGRDLVGVAEPGADAVAPASLLAPAAPGPASVA